MRTTLLTCCLITSGLLMAAPRFIGAEAYGVRPGHELIWRVPIHAAEKVEAVSLPEGIAFAREVADRILFIDHGKIAAEGSPEAFFNNQSNPRVREFLSKVL